MLKIIYVGDPMCSWCWGISGELKKLRDHFIDQLPFTIVVGGLRPGGGEPWNEEMKKFLRHHWEEVNQMSGKRFGYKIFDLEDFNYDTEPACRAVVAVRPFAGANELEFFESIQHKFYVLSEDPGKEEFYESICSEMGISYTEFLDRFNSDEIKKATYDEFILNRQWGVRGYPTVLLQKDYHLNLVTNGYADYSSMKKSIDHFLK